MKEIERKWLMDGFPELEFNHTFMIRQLYLSTNPEVRIRLKGISDGNHIKELSYKLCIKGEGDLKRTEVEKELDFYEYKSLLDLNDSNMDILKLYRVFDYNGYKLEVSEVDDGKFYYAEIEFKSEEDANAFIAPSWFGEEVTYDRDYKMKNYFKRKNGIEY